MNKKLKRKQALIMAEPYRTPFNSKVAKVNGDVIEDSVGVIKYATSFDGATKIVDGNKNKIKIKDGVYNFGKSVNVLDLPDIEETTVNGITYSIKDGVIIVNGVSSERNATAEINLKNSIGNGTYSFNAFTTVGSRIDVYVNEPLVSLADLSINTTKTNISLTSATQLVLYFPKGIQYDNRVLKPMLVSGSTIPTKYYSGSYGIKIEVADGVATLNGINGDTSTIWIWFDFVETLNGTYSFNSFAPMTTYVAGTRISLYDNTTEKPIAQLFNNEYSSTIELTNYECKRFGIASGSNQSYDNVTIKPMLVNGSTIPTTFEPNFKNLLEFGDKEGANDTGITYSIKNGVITFSATPSETIRNMTFHFNAIGINVDDTYSIALFNQFTSPIGFFVQDKGNAEGNIYLGINENIVKTWTVTTGSQYEAIVVYLDKNKTYTNEVIKPILVSESTIPSQFIPFANPYFVSLGQNGNVQYNGLEPREIDLKGNVISKINNQASDKLSNYALTKNTKVVDLGSLTWNITSTSTSGIIRFVTTDLKNSIVGTIADNQANLLCTMYITVSANATNNKTKGIAVESTGTVSIYDPEYNTSDKLEAFKKAIRGTLLMYQVKNSTTINTTSFKTFKEDTNATISDDNFTSSPNAITETFKPTRSYDFKVNGFSNVVKSSNLFFLPDIATTTKGGITFSTINQKMNLSGTSTQQYIVYYSKEMTDKMVIGKTYFLQCGVRDRSIILQANILRNDDTYAYYNSYGASKFTWTSDFKSINIVLQNASEAGTTIDLSNITFGLYETDNVSIPYEPYFDPYIENFADKRNLLTPPYIESSTKNGVSVVNNNDGTFTFNGRATATSTFVIWGSQQLPRGTYYFKSNTDDNRVYLYNETTNKHVIWNSDYFVANGTDKYRIEFIIYSGVTVSNYITKPMLIQGKTAPTTFLPYQDKYSAFLNVKGKNLFDNVNTPIIFVTFSGSNQIVYRYAGNVSKAIYLKKGKYTFKSDKNMIIGKVINWTGDLGSKVGEVVKGFSATIELEKDMYVLITNNYRYEYNL